MLHEGLLTKYLHIAAVVASYWYVYRLFSKYSDCSLLDFDTVRSGAAAS